MKKYPPCMMCAYAMGRTCKKTNKIISDDIYNCITPCKDFKSLNEEECDCDDKCCSENKRYESMIDNYEK